MSEPLSVTIDGHIATVTLNRKTMDPELFGSLEPTFGELAANREVRVIVLCSGEKCFTYGLDLPKTLQAHGKLFTGGGLADVRLELFALIKRWQRGFDAIAGHPAPIICAIHGWCIGGGLDLAATCDIRLCSQDAKFSLRETRIAIVADMGSLQRLPYIIGQGATRELAFTGKDIDAERALEIGLVNSVHEDREATLAAAYEMAEQIAANSPLAVRGVKELLNYGQGRTVAEGLDYVTVWNSAFLASQDLGEAASAFMMKREPVFKGK